MAEDEVGTILGAALPMAGLSGHVNPPYLSSREGHHSTAQWSFGFSPSETLLKRRFAKQQFS